ncbi:MAG: globin domain-containing protein [Ilumatobacter sp.]
METTGLSAETRAIIASTRPALESHGLAITTRMYERLFTEHPATEALFAGTAPGQPERLASAVLAYADNIDDLSPIEPVVAAIAAKHVAAGVGAEHYPVVGAALLGAMVDVLGELDTSITTAWAEAYGYLADIFISVEAGLRDAA